VFKGLNCLEPGHKIW